MSNAIIPLGISRSKNLARTRFQEGSLFLRGTRKKVWVARWREDVEIEGESKPRRIHKKEVLGTLADFPTKRLAQRALKARIEYVNKADYKPTKLLTFADLADRWQERIMVCTHKPSSQSSEKTHINKWLAPAFGELNVNEMTKEGIQAFFSDMQCSPKTRKNIFATFRMIWRTAMDWGYVKEDLTHRVKLSKLEGAERIFLLPEQASLLISSAEKPFNCMFWLVAETGIRGGELCGLQIDDLNFEKGLLFIRRSAYRGVLQTPKSRKAIRTIPLSKDLLQHLTEYIKTWQPNEMNLLFATKNGTPYDNQNIVQWHLQPLLEKLKLPKCGLHALRHMSATIMDSLSIPLNIRQDRLGHADITMTLGTYTHSISADQYETAEKIGKILRPIGSKLFDSENPNATIGRN